MKKVLLSLLAVAALVLSCQNYDDEFAALNSKVASLESQISSLAGLQTALTQVQSSVSALQAAVSAIPNLSSEVAAILADLSDLETAVSGATTSADLDALKAELNTTLAALQALIEANSSSIASVVAANADLKAKLEALGVDVDAILAANSTFEGNLTITNAAELAYAKSLGAKVKSIKGDLIVTVDEPGATAYRPAGNGNGVTAAEVNTVLSQITFVIGNVRITTDASLDLSALTTVSGDYSVSGHDVDDSALASVGDDMYIDYDGPISFPALTNVDNVYVNGAYVTTASTGVAAATTAGTLKIGQTSIEFMGLNKATGVSVLQSNHTSGGAHTSGSSAVINDSGWPTNYMNLSASTTSVKMGQVPVTTVTGTGLTALELHYAADYDATTNKLGSAALPSLSVTAAKLATAVVKAAKIGGAVTFSIVDATTTKDAIGSVTMSATAITGAYTSNALSNDLTSLKTVGGISLTEQASVSLPALTASTGALSFAKATTLSADKLVTIGSYGSTSVTPAALTANKVTGAAAFPALTKAGAVSMTAATSFTAIAAKVASIDIEEFETGVPTAIKVASVSSHVLSTGTPVAGTISDAGNVTTVELHAQDVTYPLANFTEATSITYIGKANAAGAAVVDATVTSANDELVTLTLGGVLNVVSIDTNAAVAATTSGTTATDLATVVTSGTIASFTVQNNYDLKTLTLGHTDDVKSATASIIQIKNNNQLSTFTTSVKKISNLTVTGNGSLGSFDLSSISELPNNWTSSYAVTIAIHSNETAPNARAATFKGTDLTTAATVDKYSNWYGLKGTYTAASATTSESYGQSSLATLKPFLAVLDAKYHPTTGSISVSNLSIRMDYRYDNTAVGQTNPSTAVKSLTGATAANFDTYATLQ